MVNIISFRMRRWVVSWVLVVGAVAVAGWLESGPPGSIAGEATVRVVDGDTLEIGDEMVRLLAMDAPEARQTCRDGAGATWRCGEAATSAMEKLVAGHALDCPADRHDRWGRLLAICTVGGVDIGGELVRLGLAVTYRDTPRYAGEEAEARAAGRGMWAAPRRHGPAIRRQRPPARHGHDVPTRRRAHRSWRDVLSAGREGFFP